MKTLMTSLALAAAFAAHAQTFFVTQNTSNSTSKLYRFGTSVGVSTFNMGARVVGMTRVPAGYGVVGNMNGGAQAGNIIGFGNGGVYRLDNPFSANPSFAQIGSSTALCASPVFANGRLWGIGGDTPAGSYITEIDMTTFSEISREATGVMGGPGGMIHVGGNTFGYVEFQTDNYYHYTLGSGNVSTTVGPTVNHDYAGLEAYGGTIYASFAIPAGAAGGPYMGFGTLDPNNGSYTELRNLDVYNLGQTGLAVVPEPATLAVFGLGALGAIVRRRRRS